MQIASKVCSSIRMAAANKFIKRALIKRQAGIKISEQVQLNRSKLTIKMIFFAYVS